MATRKIIALITDFAISDGYIGVMKGVILSINPSVEIVDLAHEINKHDILSGAFILSSALKYFPKGTIFVGVIDPGVGTERKGIAIKTKNYYFVGPNNGLFSLATMIDPIEEIVELKNSEYFLPSISYTFHGRDIFAPVAAWISKGVKLRKLGPKLPLSEYVTLDIGEPRIEKDSYTCTVIGIDGFGNIITNLSGEIFERREGYGRIFLVYRQGREERFLATYVRTYGEAEEGENIILIGSHGNIEIAVNKGSAAERLGIKVRDKIIIKRLSTM